MGSPRAHLLVPLTALLVVGSCVGGEDPTGVRVAEVAVALQPALIPSAADAGALPVNRIRAVVSRQPDGVLLREQRFDVLPTAASWTIDVNVPVTGGSVDVIVYLYLLHVDAVGAEAVQFSGRTDTLTVSVGTRIAGVDADVVRGPLDNLLITGVSITSQPDTLLVGQSATLAASVTAPSGVAYELFWTSLDPAVLALVDSVATGIAPGTAEVVASAGAHADTVSVIVIVPPVDSVRVSPDSADVQAGATRTYSAQVFDANGNALSGRAVAWSTGNASIATVGSTSGVVTGVAPGTTTVIATSEGVSDQAVVRVTAVPTGGGGTISWSASGSGAWSNPDNWSPARIPAPGDTVRIEAGGDYTVTMDVDATVARVVVNGATDVITLDIGDHSLTITAASPGPELDIGTFGRVQANGGSIVAGDVANHGTISAAGVLQIETALLLSDGNLDVGTGFLTITHPTAGLILNSGDITVGAGASLTVGANVDLRYSGGIVSGPGAMFLAAGNQIQLQADLTLDGLQLYLENSEVDDATSERITITNGAALFVDSSLGPSTLDAKVVVEGGLYFYGGTATVTDSLRVEPLGFVVVGGGSNTTVISRAVENYGLIGLAGTSDVSFGPGDTGRIVNRAGALMQSLSTGSNVINAELVNQGDLYIGGPTQLIREDGGGTPVGADHVNAAGADIDIAALGGDLTILLGGIDPTFTNSGTITIGSGTTLAVENLSNPPGQVIAMPGALFQGTGTVDLTAGTPSLVGVNDGSIAPGDPGGTGILTWRGSVPMGTAGSIDIELAGTIPGVGHDQLNISGTLVADGTLNVTGSFSAYQGDRFPVLTFGTLAGSFDQINLPLGIPGVTFAADTIVTVGAAPDTLVVEVVAGPAPVIAADWPFDEGTGQLTFDILGQGNDGTLGSGSTVDSADPAWTTGRFGAALAFVGGDFVQVPDHATLEPTTLTIEAFVRASAPGTDRYIVAKGGGPLTSNKAAYALHTGPSGGLFFYTGVEGSPVSYESADAGTGVWDGSWHHVAGTFDGSTVRLWVDGVEVGTATTGAALSYATGARDLTIGAFATNGSLGFTGDIDEVRLWSRVLTPAEIAARASRSAIALNGIIGPAGSDADAIDAPGGAVNLVGTASGIGPTTLAAGAANPPTIDFNTYGSVDRTTGFERSDLLAVRADRKHDGAFLVLDLDNDGSFANEVAQQGFGMHANRFVTFDLAVIRAGFGFGSNQTFTLTGVAGMAGFPTSSGMSLAVLLDGVPLVMHDVAGGATTSLPFSVPVSGSARFLSFVTLEGIEPQYDHGGFAQVVLTP